MSAQNGSMIVKIDGLENLKGRKTNIFVRFEWQLPLQVN